MPPDSGPGPPVVGQRSAAIAPRVKLLPIRLPEAGWASRISRCAAACDRHPGLLPSMPAIPPITSIGRAQPAAGRPGHTRGSSVQRRPDPLAMLQAEFSLTQVLADPATGRTTGARRCAPAGPAGGCVSSWQSRHAAARPRGPSLGRGQRRRAGVPADLPVLAELDRGRVRRPAAVRPQRTDHRCHAVQDEAIAGYIHWRKPPRLTQRFTVNCTIRGPMTCPTLADAALGSVATDGTPAR